LLALSLVACSKPAQQVPVVESTPKPMVYSTTSQVLAEPLPGRNLKISITAKEKSLYIVNCNEHIVVALYAVNSNVPVWGGVSNACLSQSIIVPANSTLSFNIPIGEIEPVLATDITYKAQVFGVLQGLDVKSPPVPLEMVTSNEFKLIP
jgi:hypothetical protein